MDGVRGYWDGSTLKSRFGREIPVPLWFTKPLPRYPLDGELWMGRDSFERLMTVLKSGDAVHPEWESIGYHLYDLPASPAPYEERMKCLEALKPLPSHLHIVESIECKGGSHLNLLLDSILELRGEGIMARQPQSLYDAAVMTYSLLKVKV